MSWADDVIKVCEERKISLGRVVQKAIIETYSILKVRSPVGNPSGWKNPKAHPGYVGGRFRNNWQYGVTSKPTGTLGVTGGPALPNVGPDAHLHRHYIVNNLPYARALEHGHSKQAPNGFVGLTVIEWPSIVARALASESK